MAAARCAKSNRGANENRRVIVGNLEVLDIIDGESRMYAA
jgi:hypothetical protein